MGTEVQALGLIWIFSQKSVESILTLFLVNILIEALCAVCNKPSAIYVS